MQRPRMRADISHKHGTARYCSTACKERARRARPGSREKQRANEVQWLERNRDRKREQMKAWREANAERHRATMRQWQIANPDRVRLHANKRRALKLSAVTHEFTEKDWLRLVRRFGGRCAYCSESCDALQLEHVIPLSRGGTNSIGNYLPACPTCNRSKRDRLLSEWRYRRKGVLM